VSKTKTIKAFAVIDGDGINRLDLYDCGFEIYDDKEIAELNAGKLYRVAEVTITWEEGR
jgi:hypothetical protein